METFTNFSPNFYYIYLNQKRGVMKNVDQSILQDIAKSSTPSKASFVFGSAQKSNFCSESSAKHH